MSERLEKLYTLTDIDNLPEAPVTIEAGGLIKDNQTGRVIARMYLKNCSEKPLSSVLVGFRPHGENGRIVSGMRDYLYDADGVPVGEIFGDQTGILFDNNETKSFSASVEEVDFEDGEYWDADEARKKAEELKLIVPEEKEPVQQEPAAWEKPAEPVKAPEVWKSESAQDEPHSADIYGAAIVEQKMEAPVEDEFVPASLEARQYEHGENPAVEARQLEHEERPALEEETDAYRNDQEKAVIELDGPSDEEGPVIELGGPVEEETPAESEEVSAVEEATPEIVGGEEKPAIEAAPEAEPVIEEISEAEPEETPVEASEPEEAQEPVEAPEPEEAPEPKESEGPEEAPEPEEPTGPVRLADMYSGISGTSTLASLAALYGMKNAEPEVPAEEPVAKAEPVEETPAEAPAQEAQEAPAPIEEEVSEASAPFEKAAPEVSEASVPFEEAAPVVPEEPAPVEKAASEVSEAPAPIEEEVSETSAPVEEAAPKVPEEPAPVAEAAQEVPAADTPEPIEQTTEAEPERHSVIEDMENPWTGYSADYAPPLGAIKEEKPIETQVPVEEVPAAEEASAEEVEAVPADQIPTEETPATEAPAMETPALETPAMETPAEKAEELAEEHIPTIEETIELPKAVVPEKSPEDASEILAAAAAKTEAESSEAVTEKAEEAIDALGEEATETTETTEAAEEAKPLEQKADVVFAQENEVIPSIIDDSKEKALTGEDHSGRNLLNIVVFGGIALIILLVLLIKM